MFSIRSRHFFIFKHTLNFNFLYDGSISDKIKTYEANNELNGYSRQIRNTEKKLLGMGIKDPLNYELHVPMPVEKNNLKKVLDKGDKLLWRSMYGNMFSVGGIQTKDVKVYKELKDIDTFVSTTEGESFNMLFTLKLRDMFNTPTEYECDI